MRQSRDQFQVGSSLLSGNSAYNRLDGIIVHQIMYFSLINPTRHRIQGRIAKSVFESRGGRGTAPISCKDHLAYLDSQCRRGLDRRSTHF